MIDVVSSPEVARIPLRRWRTSAAVQARPNAGGRLDAAVALDRELTALSGADARCRLIRARIIARLIERRAWLTLGFVRLGDYARERLGTSPRSLEEDARVVRALDRLPAMRAALESGSLAWTRARLLVGVATPENEARLLEESSRVAYRDLPSFIQEAAAEARCPPSSPPFNESMEENLRWSISVSRVGHRLWRAACEYASRTAGSRLSAAQALELVAAEASASISDSPASPSPEEHERRLKTSVQAKEMRERRRLQQSIAETGAAEGFPWLTPNARNPGSAGTLDDLGRGLDEAPAAELERRLQRIRSYARKIDARLATLLRIGIDQHLFQEIGFASAKLYVESRLGISVRTAWNLVSLDRDAQSRSRLLHEAWREGRLTSLQARALMPVATDQNAETWISRASEVTLRRLHDEVAWALDHDEVVRAARSAGEYVDASPSAVELAPPDDSSAVRPGAAGNVTLAEVQNRAHGELASEALSPHDAVDIAISAPVSIIVLVETTLDRLARPGEARWQTFERMLALALLEWMSAPAHRDPIFARDGWRCAVPACTSRRELHDHHVKFRSIGGDGELTNRITVCAAHHLHGIHAEVIHVEGRAPDELHWRTPFGRLTGDRYERAG